MILNNIKNRIIDYKIKNFNIYIFSYLLLVIVMVLLGFFKSNEPENFNNSIRYLAFNDFLFIFIFNLIQILIWIFLSPFLVSFFMISQFLFSIGQGPIASNIDFRIYYLSSFLHGTCEIIVAFLVFIFTIEQIRAWFYFFRYKNDTRIKQLYLWLLKGIIPTIIIILLIGAFIEVYISNRLINYFFI